jgi:hypothetical protein
MTAPCGSDPAFTELDAWGALPLGELRTLPSKLAEWDANADEAFEDLLRWIVSQRNELLAVARGRHVWGHYRYADRNYYEYDVDRLVSEAAEEIADAINYFTRRRVLKGA